MDRKIKDCRVVLTDVLKFGKHASEGENQIDVTDERNVNEAEEPKLTSSMNCESKLSPTNISFVEDSVGKDANQSSFHLEPGKAFPLESKLFADSSHALSRSEGVKCFVKKRKRHLRIQKRRIARTNISLSMQNQAKNHLLKRYGMTLLRKPSFFVEKCEDLNVEDTVTDQKERCTANVASHVSSGVAQLESDGCVDQSDSLKVFPDDSETTKNSATKQEECLATKCESQKVNRDYSEIKKESEIKTGSSSLPANVLIEDIQESSRQYANPPFPMPPVGISVNVGIGHPLKPQQVKCVLSGLEKCRNSITSDYAKFCSSVVKGSLKSSTDTLVLPISDKGVLEYMAFKWNSKSIISCNAANISESKPLNAPICGIDETVVASRISSGPKIKEEIPEESNSLVASSRTAVIQTTPKLPPTNSGSSIKESKINLSEVKSPLRRRGRKRKVRTLDVENGMKSQNSDFGTECSPLSSTSDEKLDGLAGKRTKITLLPLKKNVCQNVLETEPRLSNTRRTRQGINYSAFNVSQSCYSKADSDEESRFVSLKTVEKGLNVTYDPDDTRGSEEFEPIPLTAKEKPRAKSLLLHELRRLNVALFDVTNCSSPIVCRTPEICRLGCVCSSLTSEIVRDNCGLVKCMFGCVCLDPVKIRRENSLESFTWVQKKAKANLAKEEQYFKQTVVRSGTDKVIHVEGKRKREIKLPKRYREADIDEPVTNKARRVSNPHKESPVKVCSPPKVTKGIKVRTDLIKNDLRKSSDDRKLALQQALQQAATHLQEDPSFRGINNDENCVSARTSVYNHKSREQHESKLQHLLNDSHSKKIEAVNQIQIVSTQSLLPEEWDKLDKESDPQSNESLCSYLFSSDYIEQKKNKVVLLSWDSLRNDICNKHIYMWLQASLLKPKIYLTQECVSPFDCCFEFQSIDASSVEYNLLPFHLKSLRLDYTPFHGENKCTWIAKYCKSNWMIVGYLQPGQHVPKIEDKENESIKVDISRSEESLHHRWWVMDIKQDFDLIYFIDFKKAVTKTQITTLIKLSNEFSDGGNKIHRIILNRRRKKDPQPVLCPDFGAYTLPDHPSEVLIGPYQFSQEPRFQVYTQKIALNGKMEFEVVPLFCITGGECVRVNRQGALSLHSETLPSNYVKGQWVSISANDTRESCKVSSDELLRNMKAQIIEEALHSSQVDKISSLSVVSDEEENSSVVLLQDSCSEELSVPVAIPHNVRSKGACQPKIPVTLLPKAECDVSKSTKKEEQAKAKSIVNGDSDSLETEKEVTMEYLVPNVKQIGVLSLTHLPCGGISVTHFTEPGLLKFYRSKEEIIRDINSLIHKKLSCLSQKCSISLRDDECCTCVTWVSVLNKQECENLPQFTSEIFNGFFMLTKYGLVDLRLLNAVGARMLGEDGIEWLKNEKVKLKSAQWESKENQEINKMRLVELLTQGRNSNLSLEQTLVMATSEIAKLKAEDQLLDHESQTHQLMRETLIYSLCRKFNGIPSKVIPKFLAQLDLDILWEIIECLDSRNIDPVPGARLSMKQSTTNKKDSLDPPSQDTLLKAGLKRHALTQEAMVEERLQKYRNRTLSKDQFHIMNNPAKGSVGSEPYQEKESLVGQLSPFSGLNICVAKGAITPERPVSPSFLVENSSIHKVPSPKIGSPPKILCRSKSLRSLYANSNLTDTVVLLGSEVQRRERKQTFSSNSDIVEEPIFIEDLPPPKAKLTFQQETSNAKSSLHIPSVQPCINTCLSPINPDVKIAQVASSSSSCLGKQPDKAPPSSVFSTLVKSTVFEAFSGGSSNTLENDKNRLMVPCSADLRTPVTQTASSTTLTIGAKAKSLGSFAASTLLNPFKGKVCLQISPSLPKHSTGTSSSLPLPVSSFSSSSPKLIVRPNINSVLHGSKNVNDPSTKSPKPIFSAGGVNTTVKSMKPFYAISKSGTCFKTTSGKLATNVILKPVQPHTVKILKSFNDPHILTLPITSVSKVLPTSSKLVALKNSKVSNVLGNQLPMSSEAVNSDQSNSKSSKESINTISPESSEAVGFTAKPCD